MSIKINSVDKSFKWKQSTAYISTGRNCIFSLQVNTSNGKRIVVCPQGYIITSHTWHSSYSPEGGWIIRAIHGIQVSTSKETYLKQSTGGRGWVIDARGDPEEKKKDF